MPNVKIKFSAAALLALLLCAPVHAWAHASDQGFVLLLPTDIYTVAGTLAVAISLILVGASSGPRIERLFTSRRVAKLPRLERMQTGTSLIATGVFWTLIWIGAYGPTDPQRNLLPLVIWTGWWVALVVVQGLVGDVWRWINPWTGFYAVVFRGAPAPRRLPAQLGRWPAVGLMLAAFGFVIADIAPADPRRLAQFAMIYWVFTLSGMTIFGPRDWLNRVECFSVMFRMFADLSALRWQKYLRIGVPGWRVLAAPAPDLSVAAFCVVLLASGSFDGLHETFWWLAKIGINPLAFPGRSAVVGPSSLGLIAANLALVVVFAAALWLGLALARRFGPPGSCPDLRTAFAAFSVTLLPLAFGYHLAHYLTSYLVQSQYLMAAIGDPMARGANVLGLGARTVTTGFFNDPAKVRLIWLTQAGVVVGSHMLSVMLAHVVASRLFRARKQIVLVQVGLGILMILYTIFGLWLLAAPRGV